MTDYETRRASGLAALRMRRATLRGEIALALINLALSLGYHYVLFQVPLTWAELLILWAPGALHFVRSFTDSFSACAAERAAIDVLTVQLHVGADGADSTAP